MAVTPADIAVELGRPTPPDGSDQRLQWQSWIDQSLRAIARRARRLGTTIDALVPDDVDDVVLWAVVRRITRPVDGAESTTDQLQVDDGSVNQTRRYPTGHGDIHILDQWWEMLGLVEPLADGWSGSIPYVR